MGFLPHVQQNAPPKGRRPRLLCKEGLGKGGLADAAHAVQPDDAYFLAGHGRLQLLHALPNLHMWIRLMLGLRRQRAQQVRKDLADQHIVAPASGKDPCQP